MPEPQPGSGGNQSTGVGSQPNVGGGSFGGPIPDTSIKLNVAFGDQILRILGFPAVGTGLGTDNSNTHLVEVSGLAVDDAARVYVCDRGSNQIRMYSISQPPTVVAGSILGEAGYVGDNLPANVTRLNRPTDMLRDLSTGAIYFCDQGNDRIRYFIPGGRIYTLVGGGGDFSYSVSNALNAGIKSPSGLSLNNDGTIFFTEAGSSRVRRLSSGKTLTTIADFSPLEVGAIATSADGKTAWVIVDNQIVRISTDPVLVQQSGDVVFSRANRKIGALRLLGTETLLAAVSNVSGISSQIVALPLLVNGLLDSTRKPIVVAGTTGESIAESDFALPDAGGVHSIDQRLGAIGAGSIYVKGNSLNGDLEIYFGHNYAASTGQAWGQVGRIF